MFRIGKRCKYSKRIRSGCTKTGTSNCGIGYRLG